jgi:hypothetical protein
MFIKNSKTKVAFFVLILSSIFFSTSLAQAAVLQISPSNVDLTVGKTTTLSVLVNSAGVAINNAEATIAFPSDLLEVLSVSKAGSVFNLWVEEPSFSNTTGRISFSGGIPTPGFSGASGKVISFVVRGKKAGNASFDFSSAAVRADDGLGTDVLSSNLASTATIIESKIKEPETVKQPVNTKKEESVKNVKEKSKEVEPLIEEEELMIDTTVTLLVSPKISLSSEKINKRGSVTVFGRSDYPNKQVNIYLFSGGKLIGKYNAQVDSDGLFSVTINKIKTIGTISIWAESVVGSQTSEPSDKLELLVVDQDLIKLVFNKYILFSLLFVYLALLVFGLYGWQKYLIIKRK